jgi:hypothetical protein
MANVQRIGGRLIATRTSTGAEIDRRTFIKDVPIDLEPGRKYMHEHTWVLPNDRSVTVQVGFLIADEDDHETVI